MIKVICDRCGKERTINSVDEIYPVPIHMLDSWYYFCQDCLAKYPTIFRKAQIASDDVIKAWLTKSHK